MENVYRVVGMNGMRLNLKGFEVRFKEYRSMDRSLWIA